MQGDLSSAKIGRLQLYVAYVALAIAIVTLIAGLSVTEVRRALCQRFGVFCSANVHKFNVFAFDYTPPPLPDLPRKNDEPGPPGSDAIGRQVLAMLEEDLIDFERLVPAPDARLGPDADHGFIKRNSRRLYWELTLVHPASPSLQEFVIHTTLYLPASLPQLGSRVELTTTKQSEPNTTTSRFVSLLSVGSKTVDSWPIGSYDVVLLIEGSGFSEKVSGKFALIEPPSDRR